MKKILFSTMAAAGLLAMTGCSDERSFVVETEGSLRLSASFSTDVKVASRATLEEELSESSIVWISRTGENGGVVRKYNGLANVPSNITLLGGNYVAEVWAGDSVSASYDKRYFKGRAPFTITTGNTSVEVACKIANVVTSVKYSDGIENALTDFKLTIGHARGSLEFEGRDERKGYFMMPSGCNTLDWTLTGKQEDGSAFSKTGVIENVKPTTEYIFSIKYANSSEAVGGAFVTIEIDETEIVKNDNILIAAAPMIQGVGFDIADGVMGNSGSIGKQSVYISAAARLTSVIIDSEDLTPIVGGNDIDLVAAKSTVVDQLSAGGINFDTEYDATEDLDAMKIRFEASFLDALAVGEHTFTITAADANGKSTTKVFKVTVSEAKVEAAPISDDDIDYQGVTLRANLINPDAQQIGFLFREAGNASRSYEDWTFIPAETISGGIYTATVTGLTMGHTYEYKAKCDDYEGMIVKSFTTKSVQLPNSGFEDWDTSSSPYMIYAAGGDMFWDSGNTGSATMKKNVTVPESTIKHSGAYSIKLASQFVGIGTIGKFAAGNVFIGKYLDTDGTDGVLGWGRPFTEKPIGLKGYVKYNPAQVAYEDASFADLKKGDMDEGIIYIALLDNHTENYKGTDWPVVIKTKSSNRQLFDKNSEHVIAYGQIIFKEATAGSGMVEFYIPLTYLREDVTPSFIMCTAAASRGGDYFVGGPSTMYLDDFELVY